MHHPADPSYRSLELLCRRQAALSSTPDAGRELLRMALEYERLADLQDKRTAEIDTRK
jgi:hypothetical protein